MLGAVEFVPLFSIAEPEIRATVDDQHIVGQLGSNPGRCTMRECEENDIMTGKVVTFARMKRAYADADRAALTA